MALSNTRLGNSTLGLFSKEKKTTNFLNSMMGKLRLKFRLTTFLKYVAYGEIDEAENGMGFFLVFEKETGDFVGEAKVLLRLKQKVSTIM